MDKHPDIHDTLVEAGIKYVVCVPDSVAGPLIRQIVQRKQIRYIQPSHEADCVGISTGLNLTGTKSLVLMENSGLRSACEIISRFHLSHALYTIYIISHRGAFGERNWWGQAHDQTMVPLLSLLRFRYIFVDDLQTFKASIRKAIDDFEARQSSTAIIVTADVFRQIGG